MIVTGPGGRGMTLSPAIAAETFEGVGLVIRLAVLDMAGTTVSDGGVVERSFVEALGGMGFDPDGAELRDAPRLRARARWASRRSPCSASVFGGDEARAQEANRRFETAFDARGVARRDRARCPGAETALDALRARGVRICLTTGFSPATREQLMDVLGWRDLVDLSLSPGDGVRGRPYPDLILTALDAARASTRCRRSRSPATRRATSIAGHRGRARRSSPGCSPARTTGPSSTTAPHTHVLDSIADLPAASPLTRLDRSARRTRQRGRAAQAGSRRGRQVSRPGTARPTTLASSSARRSASSASRSGAAASAATSASSISAALRLERHEAARR